METIILLLKLKLIILMLKSASSTESSLCNSRELQCLLYKVLRRKVKKVAHACPVEPCPCQPAVAPGITLASLCHLRPSRTKTLCLVSEDGDLHTGSLLCRSGGGGALRNTWKGRIRQREMLSQAVVVVPETSADPQGALELGWPFRALLN